MSIYFTCEALTHVCVLLFTPCRVNTVPRLQRIASERLGNYVKTAWSVDPRIALSLVARFPGSASLKAEVSILVLVRISFFLNMYLDVLCDLCFNMILV